MLSACPIPSEVTIPCHAILKALRRRNVPWLPRDEWVNLVLRAILEEAPTSDRYPVAEWTAMRANALVLLSFMHWDQWTTYYLLLKAWTDCCNNPFTRKAFACAAIKEIERELDRGLDLRQAMAANRRHTRLGLEFLAEFVMPRVLNRHVTGPHPQRIQLTMTAHYHLLSKRDDGDMFALLRRY